MACSSPVRAQQSYRHEAFLWHGRAGFIRGLIPFVREGIDAGEAVMVAVIPEHADWIRQNLGPTAAQVHFVDMIELGRNPARMIPAWQAFLDDWSGVGRPARGIGEPIWHGLIGMDRFMQGRYGEAAEQARHTVTGLPHLPFFWLLLTAALVRDQQTDEAARVWADFRARHPDFVVGSVPALWPATQKDFVAGRDLIAATVQALDARPVANGR